MKERLTISAWSVLRSGETADVSFVPPLARRRLSPLQKIFFALANSVGEGGEATVFASRDGEDTLTRRLVADFQSDGSVSPHRFSSSVYNAAPGLWSIQTKNVAPYTAIAAGEETIECGLYEALAHLPGLFVYAEETEGGYGSAVRFTAENAGGVSLEITGGDPRSEPITFAAWIELLSGSRDLLVGRRLTLRKCS